MLILHHPHTGDKVRVAIRNFCERIGVAKRDSTVDIALLEYSLREDLNRRAPRVMGVLRPLRVVIVNYPEDQVEELEALNNPEDASMGTRLVPFSRPYGRCMAHHFHGQASQRPLQHFLRPRAFQQHRGDRGQRRQGVFNMLNEGDLQELGSAVREHHYRKNVVIVHMDDPGNSLFVLKSGVVKVTIDDAGREMILRMLYPTDFFGDMSLIDGMPRSASVTTLEPSEALIIHREHFVEIIEKSPTILLNMAAVLSRRLRATDELIRSLAFFDVYGKVARVLLTLVAEKGRATEQGTVIDLRLTQQELAELAGMSRETMTRTLGAFQQAGVVHIEAGVITILSIEMLRREMNMA